MEAVVGDILDGRELRQPEHVERPYLPSFHYSICSFIELRNARVGIGAAPVRAQEFVAYTRRANPNQR